MPMHTIIHPAKSDTRSRVRVDSTEFRSPHYDCTHQDDVMKLLVYVPGVDAAGVEIKLHGPDLVVTARKTHFVRVNWAALHLEGAQRDYRLSLRIGRGYDPDGLRAELEDGVLTITLLRSAENHLPARRVA